MKNRRVVVVFIMLLSAYSLLCARLYYIQVWNREVLSERARRQWMRVSQSEPLKSSIYDRKGRVLAFSGYADSVHLNPRQLKNNPKAVAVLCEKLSLDKEAVMRDIKNSGSYFMWLKRKVQPSEADEVKELKIKGVGCVKERKRFYSDDRLASILLGMVGMDDRGLSGIEQVVNNIVKENKTKVVYGRDAKGRYIDWDGRMSSLNPNGHVYLTIDKTIQYISEKEIGAIFDKTKPKWASAIVQDVKTGEILAMAVYPRFSNAGIQSISAQQQLTNHAIATVFEPGSTFKIIPFAAAIEEKLFSAKSKFDCFNGKFAVASHVIHDHDPKQVLSFAEVFEQSSNIGTAQIGMKAGKDKLYYYARAFGFGTRTGIVLAGEAPGLLKNPKSWSGISLPMISFGQEVGVTCLQLISSYSAIANGGVLLEPQIIARVENDKKEPIWEVKPKRIRRVISQASASEMIKIMEGVVENGTGKMARVDGYGVAGKTGTAQKFSKELNRYCPEKHVASFCGFLPAKNPEIAILVVVDEPHGDYWGGTVAAPVFGRIAKQIASYLNIAPDKVDYAYAGLELPAARN